MVRLIPLLLVFAAVLHELAAQSAFSLSNLRRGSLRLRNRRPPKVDCSLRNDQYNPFYWHGQENICTKEICAANPLLYCNVTRDYIMDQALAHQPEDILAEVEFMEKYFQTFFPKPRNVLPYSCQGVCGMGANRKPRDPTQVTMVFADLEQEIGYTGKFETKRLLCHVIGPKIFSHQCGGPCRLPFAFGNQGNLQCVADSQVTVQAWVFCPGTYPACHKIPITVPLSCSCKKLRCVKKLPAYKPFVTKLPDLTDPTLNPFGTGGGPGGDPFGVGQDPFGTGSDPFGLGSDPFGMDPLPAGSDPFANLEPLGPAVPTNFGGTPLGPVNIGQSQLGGAHAAASHAVAKAAVATGLVGAGSDVGNLASFPLGGPGSSLHVADKVSSSMGKPKGKIH